MRRIVPAQFPQWTELGVRAVVPGGWDNRTFRLGDHLVVRMPSAAAYVPAVEREGMGLQRLADRLPVPIPKRVAVGQPGEGYPWPWSVLTWLEGEPVGDAELDSPTALASDLAVFLLALHEVDPVGGPRPGPENFFRGGELSTYSAEVVQAIDTLGNSADARLFMRIWHEGLMARWDGWPVWVHGDMSAGNLLVNDGRLSGVIDFGQCCVGDPACDLTLAWTLLDVAARVQFRRKLNPDDATWARARAWAVWKALIIATGLVKTSPYEQSRAKFTLGALAAEDRQAEISGQGYGRVDPRRA